MGETCKPYLNSDPEIDWLQELRNSPKLKNFSIYEDKIMNYTVELKDKSVINIKNVGSLQVGATFTQFYAPSGRNPLEKELIIAINTYEIKSYYPESKTVEQITSTFEVKVA